MRSATLFGFPLVANPAWLLVFALLVVSLVTSVAGTGPAILPSSAALGVSAVVVALFVVSLVIHELTHALVARRRGLEVSEVRLLALGNPTADEPDPESPLTDALVAASGPLISAVIGTTLLLAALTFPADVGEPASLAYWALYWLGLANLALALLHLVPVLPLDGGRLVRALAWRSSGDLDRATAWTAAIGRAFGYVVIGSGLFIAMFVELFVGIWLVLLGWFAGRLSRSAVDQRAMEQLTSGLTVDDAIDHDAAVIPPTLTIDTLMAQDEQEDGPGVYPVLESGRLVGVVFLSRLRRRFRHDWTEQRAADVLVPVDRAPSLRADEPLIRAVERLEALRVDGLPVVDSSDPERLAGLLTRRNLMARLRARQTLLEGRTGSTSRRSRG